jgi:hypothetical protein
MPVPKVGETEKDFVSRCIPIVMDEGITRHDGHIAVTDNQQAAAICYSMWREGTKGMTDRFQLKVLDGTTSPDLVKPPETESGAVKIPCKTCEEDVIPDNEGKCPLCGAVLSQKRHMDTAVGGGVDRDKIPAEDFAGKDRSYPIVTPGDVSDAASSIGRAGSENYPVEKLKANIIRIAKRKGAAFIAELPKAWRKEEGIDVKSLDLSYAKSLDLGFDTDKLRSLLAAKFIGTDRIFHYPFLWGTSAKTDLEREFFLKNTNFWDDVIGKGPRPLTWDHAQDKSMKADPVIGQTIEWGDDELGRWAISHLNRAHEYRKAVDKLIDEGVIGTSSDSAPQYVEREKQGKSAWLKTWPWFASALTDVPCEPRMITEGAVEYFKSIGLKFPNSEASVEQVRAMVQKAHRVFDSVRMYTGE